MNSDPSIYPFSFSQITFGGALACTSIATLTACAFCDGDVSIDDFEKYTRIGCQMWKKYGNCSTQSLEDVIAGWEFFRDTYEIESYQAFGDKAVEGRISVDDLLKEIENTMMKKHRNVGVVITDGTSSYAVGKTSSDNWYIFDSHPSPTARLIQCTTQEVKQILRVFHYSVFDATLLWRLD